MSSVPFVVALSCWLKSNASGRSGGGGVAC